LKTIENILTNVFKIGGGCRKEHAKRV